MFGVRNIHYLNIYIMPDEIVKLSSETLEGRVASTSFFGGSIKHTQLSLSINQLGESSHKISVKYQNEKYDVLIEDEVYEELVKHGFARHQTDATVAMVALYRYIV